MIHASRHARVFSAVALAAASLLLSACAGVLDRCGDSLKPPAGGWDSHGPG